MASEQLLLDTIDEKVTKVRPYDAVLDTIARQITDIKNSNNQTVRHYAIDVLDVTTEVLEAYTAKGVSATLKTKNDSLFANDQTILVKGVSGYKEDYVTVDPENDLMLYVTGKKF